MTDRHNERTLLAVLEQAQKALNSRNSLRAYGSLLEYQVLVRWYEWTGRLSPEVAQQLQADAQQVIDALR